MERDDLTYQSEDNTNRGGYSNQRGYSNRGGGSNRGGRGRGRGGQNNHSHNNNNNQPTFTHFLAFPLWEKYGQKIKQFQDSFTKYVDTLYPMYKKYFKFQSPDSQHLTIVMIDLQTDERKMKAQKALVSVHQEIKALTAGVIKLKLSDVQTFHDDDQKRVYFMDVDPLSQDFKKLLMAEDIIIRAFQKEGLLRTQKGGKEMLLLTDNLFHTVPHATFLRVAPSVNDRNFNRNIFPKIVNEFNQQYLPNGFGEVELDMVDICIRFDFGPKGEYNHLERIKFT